MNTSRDEFLLLMQNWKNSSPSVMLAVVYGDGTPPIPLSTSFMLRLKGKVIGIDGEGSFVALLVGEDGFISVGFDKASFDFKTVLDLSDSFTSDLLLKEELEEMVTLRQSSGLTVSFLALK
jgi:hypothetical protein